MSIGKFTARGAGMAADAVGKLIGSEAYPESEYGLAAHLFDRILASERHVEVKDRAYILDLMAQCLKAVRSDRGEDK